MSINNGHRYQRLDKGNMMEEKKRRGGPQKGQKFKKRKEYPLVTCPHCGQSGRGPVMNVWHFAKCRVLRGINLVEQFKGEE